MNKWSHFLAALGLAVMAFIIHILVRADTNVNKLDTVRLYSLVRDKGNVNAALSFISGWAITDECARRTNLSIPVSGVDGAAISACSTNRQALRKNVLDTMKCDTYNSQVCTLLQRVLNGVISANTTATASFLQGRDMTAKPPGYDLTYRQVIYNSVQEATNTMHNAFYAKQERDWIVLRTSIYNLITLSVLANIGVHICDAMPGWSWNYRLAMRVGVFLLSFFLSILMAFANSASLLFLFLFIFVPAILNLLYFELFLDDSIVRPWVHPYTFTVVFVSLSLLALTENDVLNIMIVTIELLKANAAAQLYMEVVWYWTGYMEKKRLGTHSAHLAEVYKTKQIQYALFMGIVLVALFPFLQFMAPYDYTDTENFLKIAPLIFVAISVVGTIFLQSLIIDDYYGTDSKTVEHRRYKEGPMMPSEEREYSSESWDKPSRITGGKLAVSALVLIFVALIEFQFVAEYIRTLRAYYDTMPEKAFQYDPTNPKSFLTGAGLYMPSVYTL